MSLSRALAPWKRLSLLEQAVWILVALLLGAPLVGDALLQAPRAWPQAAVDLTCLRQVSIGTFPWPEMKDKPFARFGRDPWNHRWRWERWGDSPIPHSSGGKLWYRPAQVRGPVPPGAAKGSDGRWWVKQARGPDPGWYWSVNYDNDAYFMRHPGASKASARFPHDEGFVFYSVGPNGLDEGGAGDDLFASDSSVSTALFAHPLVCLTLAILLALLVPSLRRHRSPRLAPELVRAALAATPATGVVMAAILLKWLPFRAGDLASLQGLLPVTALVPWQVAVAGSLALLFFLAALVLRLTRPLESPAPTPPDSEPRPYGSAPPG